MLVLIFSKLNITSCGYFDPVNVHVFLILKIRKIRGDWTEISAKISQCAASSACMITSEFVFADFIGSFARTSVNIDCTKHIYLQDQSIPFFFKFWKHNYWLLHDSALIYGDIQRFFWKQIHWLGPGLCHLIRIRYQHAQPADLRVAVFWPGQSETQWLVLTESSPESSPVTTTGSGLSEICR